MRILALTRYERLGSSSRVRFYQYFPYLQVHGVDIVSAPFFSDQYVKSLYAGQTISKAYILRAYIKRLVTLANSAAFDLLWVEKELFPWMPAWLEGILRLFKIPYVVDYDDAVYHRYDMHSSSLVRATLGRKIDRVMRSAALVVAGNEYLAERARQAGAKRVETLPSVVDVDRYACRWDPDPTSSPIKIGWVGSPVTAPYLEGIRETVHLLASEFPVQMVLIGAGDSNPFPEIQTQLLPWNEDLELSIGKLFDIGIMPLVDGPFERGKCGYKLVQYMAAGLPVVASPVGINRQMVIPGENGYLADSSQEWLEAFRKLAGDPQLRQKMGQSGRQRAEQMYNLQGTAPRLLDLLSGVRKL
jgi:glycosyltransferase involved in cell wall biosynthesis